MKARVASRFHELARRFTFGIVLDMPIVWLRTARPTWLDHVRPIGALLAGDRSIGTMFAMAVSK